MCSSSPKRSGTDGVVTSLSGAYRPIACICIRMRRAAQRVTDVYDHALKPAGISINQYSLLINISRLESCGTGELARHVRLEKSTLVRTLPPLLKAGFIIDCSPAGSRRRQLELTPLGRKVLEQAIPLWETAQHVLRAKLGARFDACMEIFAILETENPV